MYTDSIVLFIETRCDNLTESDRFSVTYTNQNHYKSEASYRCNHGYRLVGTNKRVCNNVPCEENVCTGKAEWSDKEPECKSK